MKEPFIIDRLSTYFCTKGHKKNCEDLEVTHKDHLSKCYQCTAKIKTVTASLYYLVFETLFLYLITRKSIVYSHT